MEQLVPHSKIKQRPFPNPLNPLEEGILRAVAYADLFDYPLTADQIYRYLEGVLSSQLAVDAVLANGRLCPHFLQQTNDMFHLPGRTELAHARQQREQVAQSLWPAALRYGRFIARLPFVRMVALTGSLTMNNARANADIDYLIVTENGRLWLCRAFIIAVVRAAAVQGITLCPNYLLTERAMQFMDQNIYTAHEVAQMIPLSGAEIYTRLRQQNQWVNRFLPNALSTPRPALLREHGRSRLQAVLEPLLRSPLGNRLESWEMTRKISKLHYQHAHHTEASFSPDRCKGHFQGHQHRTLAALHRQSSIVNPKP